MKTRLLNRVEGNGLRLKNERGAILVIVLWIAFGLVCLALYFGSSMACELRASDNRAAASEADQAINGAARYLCMVLSNNYGYLPEIKSYQHEAVPVGNAVFWLIGRSGDSSDATSASPYFGLVDEASKLNLNTVQITNLIYLPNMTYDVAASILNWRGDTNDTTSYNGATATTYATLKPPYQMKGTNYETVEELRLVYGVDMTMLYGEDINLNGILDANENDGDTLPPSDNKDNKLDCGLVEYLTVYTSDPNLRTNGEPRYNINASDKTSLTALLTTNWGETLSTYAIGELSTTCPSTAEFYSRIASKVSVSQFEEIADDIATTTNSPLIGQINVNTASAVVLASLPGMTEDMANKLITYRQQGSTNGMKSVAWIYSALGTNIPSSASNLTTHSYQFTADVAAVGHNGRGYKRVRFVFDTSTGQPSIIYRQDLTHLGWALGREIRNQLYTVNTR